MNICVFCGSSTGARLIYPDAATALGRAIAARGHGLVYGGASVGLMGRVADGALEAGAEVTGVLPRSLAEKELAHHGLHALHVVDSMHTRKAMMADLADAFVALPGGVGTLEETFEIWTWGQLGYHRKPLALLNVGGFYDGLAAFLDHVTAEAFVQPHHRDMVIVTDDIDTMLDRIDQYEAPSVPKWIDRGST